MSMTRYLFGLAFFIIGSQAAWAQGRVLKMGANFYNPPYLYIDANGVYTGFEADLINEIGRLKGFTVQFLPKTFPGIFEELEHREIDFIGNVYNSEQRKAKYLLSTPHYSDRIQFLTLYDKVITNPLEDHLRIATLAFSPVEEEFQNAIQADYPTLKMRSQLTTFLGFKDLFLNEADILLSTKSSIDILMKNYSQYRYRVFSVPMKYKQDVLMSYLTTKDNPKLIDDINDGVQQLKKNGVYRRLIQKYNL